MPATGTTGRAEAGSAGRRPCSGRLALAPPPGLEAAWSHPLMGRLLRAQRHLKWGGRRHPWLFDSAIVLVVAAVTVFRSPGEHGPFGEIRALADLPLGLETALSAMLVVPLWWRRRAPTAVFTVIAVCAPALMALGLLLPTGGCLLIALFNLALNGPLRRLGWAAAATTVELNAAVWFLAPADRLWQGLLTVASQEIAAIALGLALRTRRVYLAALEDRAARLEIEREQRERLTAAAERSRVAREMHDIVGHNLSVMVGLADGAATLASSTGERSEEALRMIGDTGRQAMSELRRVLGVLGDESDDQAERLSPQPGVRDLDPLLTRVRAAGVNVTCRTSGDIDALGSGVQLTVYRVVQEALTNTLKHAGTGSAANVTVTAGNGHIRISVSDTGPPPGARTSARPLAEADGPGHGLVGIRQRTAMYGGTVTAGPRDDRPGWNVDVTLTDPPASAPSPAQAPAPGDPQPQGEQTP